MHWLAYLAWPAAFVHALTAGNDMRIGWVAAIVWGSAAVLAAAVLVRLGRASAACGRDRRAAWPAGFRRSRETTGPLDGTPT